MLNDTQVSIIMSRAQEMLIKEIESNGQIYPTLILMNEKSYINVTYLMSRYSCITCCQSITITNVYVTMVTLRNRDEKDDEAIIRFIREVTYDQQADATGYIAQCLYKPMKKEEHEALTTNAMNLDPEAIRVIHNCFFNKEAGNKALHLNEGLLMVTPYIIKESSESNEFQLSDTPPNTVTCIVKGWERPSYALETRIKNPYESTRRYI